MLTTDENDELGPRIRNRAVLSIYLIQSGYIWVTANTGNYARRRDVADNGGGEGRRPPEQNQGLVMYAGRVNVSRMGGMHM